MFMFPWQHILETALMQNGAIQLSNDVTVTLFLNESLQTFKLFLEMTSGTSVQNFSRGRNALFCHVNTFFLEHLGKIESLKSLMTSL